MRAVVARRTAARARRELRLCDVVTQEAVRDELHQLHDTVSHCVALPADVYKLGLDAIPDSQNCGTGDWRSALRSTPHHEASAAGSHQSNANPDTRAETCGIVLVLPVTEKTSLLALQ
jgi:hypothetical protein